MQHHQGLIAAPFTPMTADGGVDLATIERQAAALVSGGVRGAFVCGTTGEGLSLTTAERMAVVERWLATAGANLAVIVHVGSNSSAESRALAAHAQRCGAAGIAALPPMFFKPTGLDALVHVMAEIAAAAPQLPFYFYHIPAMSGVNLSVASWLEQAARAIPTLTGVKFTHEDLMDFQLARAVDGGRFDMLFGRDEILLAAMALGARGAVGSTYNFASPIYHRIIAAYDRGDMPEAARLQMLAVRMIAVMKQFDGLAAGKAIMKISGLDCGPTRSPLTPLTIERTAELERALDAAGVLGQLQQIG
jgi:N-acetylneuraminate lyase